MSTPRNSAGKKRGGRRQPDPEHLPPSPQSDQEQSTSGRAIRELPVTDEPNQANIQEETMASKIEMPHFYGNPGQNASHWFEDFENFLVLTKIQEGHRKAILPFYLKDHAQTFYKSLDSIVTSDYNDIKAKLIERFSGTDGLDADLEILNLNQKDEETTATYFTRCLKAANGKSYPESLLISIIMKGLKPGIKQIVMPQNLATIEEVRKAAARAEKTVHSSSTSANIFPVMVNFTDTVTKQLQDLTSKLEKLQTSTPNRHQQYHQYPGMNQPPYQRQVQHSFQATYRPQRERETQRTGQEGGCNRCGEGRKHSSEHCKATNATCNFCFKVGHFYQVCRSRLRLEGSNRQ